MRERATLVLVARTSGSVLAADELARTESSRELEVIVALAPWRAGGRVHSRAGMLVFPPGAAWGDVVAACAQAASCERMLFVEVPAVQSLEHTLPLLDDLGDADVAGARLLRRDGITLESAGGGFSSARYALPLESGTVATTLPATSTSVLWVDRRAFAARRDALLATGPPHVSVGDVLAEADWCWRLALRGYRVVCSAVLVPVDEGVEPWRSPEPLEEEGARIRAGVALLATMLETDSLHRVLAQNPVAAAALAGAGNADCPQLSEPALRERRASAQAERRYDDATLARRLGAAFELDRATPVARIVGPLRLASRPRVAIMCSDVVGERLAGPAIRALESARALAPQFDVQIGVRDAMASINAPCPVRRLSTEVVRDLIAGSDAIVLQGPVSDWYPEILASDVPIAVDLYDPMNLEALESRHADELVPYTTQLLRDQVERGDFFFCASERQRDYWIGMLAGAGRVTSAAYRSDPDLRQLVDVVPFGIPGEPPVRTAPGVRGVVDGIGPDDPLLVWNGGLWGWFEPELFIRAIDIARRDVPNIRAYFMGVRDPRMDSLTREARSAIDLAERLELRDSHVFFNDWTPYEERQNVYLDATAAVSFHRAHLETRFSFRTRILDCIWASLPIVCSAGDVLADLVRDEELGIAVVPGDLEAVAEALIRIARDDELRRASQANLAALAHLHTWNAALAPLAAWLARPSRGTAAMDLAGFVPDGRTDPAPGSLTARVPLPLRKHVLGPTRRALRRAALHLGSS